MAKKILPLILFLLLAGSAVRAEAAASLAIMPAAAAIPSGTQFTVSVVVNADQAVNAAQGILTFPPGRLKVIRVSKTDSLFQFWPREILFSNVNGTVEFGAGLPAPGFMGRGGMVFRILFQSVAAGTAKVSVSGGAVLANDGRGTNVLSGTTPGIYEIGPALAPAPVQATQVASRSHPDPELWYNQPAADFSWRLVSGVDRISYELSQIPGGMPSREYDPVAQIRYSLIDKPDGVWCFNLRLHASGAWSKVITKKIKVDRTPPSVSRIRNLTIDPTDPRPIVAWSAADGASGIKGYRMKIDQGGWLPVSPQEAVKVILPLQGPGAHLLTVESADVAGNISIATAGFVVRPIPPPVIIDYLQRLPGDQSADLKNQQPIIKGQAPGSSMVRVYLRNQESTFSFDAPVAENGFWSLGSYGPLSSGTWNLTAQAEDARGALSAETASTLIVVESAAIKFRRYFGSWTTLGSAIAFGLVLIVSAILMAKAWLKRYRDPNRPHEGF